MLGLLVRYAVLRPWVVLAAAALFAGLGVHALAGLPIEAFPDVTDATVDVVATYPGQAAEEVERRVTLELERVLAGTPRMTNLRSVSVFGLSLVTLRFEDGAADRDNRAQVAERLREAALPEGVEAALGPQATPVGQIYRYTLRGPVAPRELRAIQDWTVERHLRAVPGVADVVTFGGFERRIEVRVDPVRLANAGVTVAEVFRALEAANRNAGGGYVGIGAQEFVVRGVGAARRAADLAGAYVASRDDVPVRVGDIAEVVEGSTPRRGAVLRGEDPDVVEGIALLRRGENPSVVLEALRGRVDALNREVLPRGVRIVPFYDRGELIGQTLATVRGNLLHGALLVVFVLYAFLRSARAAAIVASVIPLALLAAFLGLRVMGRSANLISLGAIDFGILVDGAVVVTEATLHALSHRRSGGDASESIAAASAGVARSVGYAVLIILAGLAPVFFLERVEGRIFAPMALTYVFALLGAAAAAFSVVPALERLAFARGVPQGEPRWLEVLGRGYARALAVLRARRGLAAGIVVAAIAAGAAGARGVGTEFLPELDEGGLYITAVFPADIALDETRAWAPAMAARVRAVPEVRDVLVHIGRPEHAPQVEGPNNVEIFAALRPRDAWRPGLTRRAIEDELRTRLREIPGSQYNFSQPITDRVYETISGVIGQVVVKVEGEDLDVMSAHAERLRAALARVPGVADLSLYQAGEAPQLAIELDRERLARNGLTVGDAEQVIDIALGGKVATALWDGPRRYDVALRLPDAVRADRGSIGLLGVGDADRRVHLAEVADLRFLRGRAAIWRENLRRFVAIKFNVRGRDLGSVVADAQRAAATVPAPDGVVVRWGGEFENQRRAMRRLASVVPPALAAILLILYAIFRRAGPTLAIAAALPVAVLGAVAGLRLAGENLSVSAAVGCVALLGQVSLAGILVCERIDSADARGAEDPLVEGAREALRPVLLTCALAALGLVPAATSHAMGSETQRPFAVAIVAGLAAALPVVLFALPLLVAPRGRGRAPASSVALASLVALALTAAAPPAWAQGARVETEAELFALWRARGLEAAVFDAPTQAARADVATAALRPNPTLSVGASGLLAGVPPDGRLNVSAQVNVPLEIGRIGARTRAAERDLAARAAAADLDRWRRAGELHRDVLDAAYAHARAELTAVVVADLERVARLIASRASAGVNSDYDADRARLELARRRAELRRAELERDVAASRALLRAAVPAVEGLAIPREAMLRPPTNRGVDALLALARRARPDLALARAAVAAADASADRWRREAVPSPEVWLGALATVGEPSASVLAGFALPLPVFDRRQGLVARAVAEGRGAAAELALAEARVDREVRDAWTRVTVATGALERFRDEGETLAEDLGARAQRAYAAGSFSITDLLDAQRAIAEARLERLSVERARDEALAELADAAAALPFAPSGSAR